VLQEEEKNTPEPEVGRLRALVTVRLSGISQVYFDLVIEVKQN